MSGCNGSIEDLLPMDMSDKNLAARESLIEREAYVVRLAGKLLEDC